MGSGAAAAEGDTQSEVSVACVLGPGRVIGHVEPYMGRFSVWAQSGLCTFKNPELSKADEVTNRTLQRKEQGVLTKDSWPARC